MAQKKVPIPITLLEQLSSRSSVRQYSKRNVPKALIAKLLDAAARTQTMGNLQLYSVVITRNQKGKDELAPLHFNQSMVRECQVVLTICADYNRTTQWCRQRKAVPGYNNFLSFLNAATDALLFTQTFSCLAEEAGLGVCFLGTTFYTASDICKLLQLPQLVVPIATLTLGWPAEKPALSDRLSTEGFLHNEHYKDYTPRDIDKYYTAKENLPENKRFVEINGKETLAQIFTDIRYTRSDNEAMSWSLMECLRQQGFLPEKDRNSKDENEITQQRPDVLECDVVRFQNNKEKWVAFVGLLNGKPYEIFTGLMDDDEGIVIPKRITKGRIIRAIAPDGTKRYDFQFENKRGFKTTVEGLSGKFNKEYWNYAKLISGVLRYNMPIERVVRLVASLSLGNDSINTWKVGVERALKKYIKEGTTPNSLETEKKKQ